MSFRILQIGDSHFGNRRLDECVRNFDFIIEYATKEKPHLIFHTGDLFDRNTSINSPEYFAAINGMQALAKIAPVYIIRGNHDPDGALDIFKKFDRFNVYDEITEIKISTLPLMDVLFVPYINPLKLGSGLTYDEVHINTTDSLRRIINKFVAKSGDFKVVVAHLSIRDAVLANSEKIMSDELILDIKDLTLPKIKMVMLGHIHNNNQPLLEKYPIRYNGAHYRYDFGEKGQPGFVMWEVGSDKAVPTTIYTPVKEMREIEIDEVAVRKFIKTKKLDFDLEDNADIKLVFNIPEGISTMLDLSALLKTCPGSSTLKIVKRIKPQIVVRSQDISKFKTEEDRFAEWGRLNNVIMTDSIKKIINEITVEAHE